MALYVGASPWQSQVILPINPQNIDLTSLYGASVDAKVSFAGKKAHTKSVDLSVDYFNFAKGINEFMMKANLGTGKRHTFGQKFATYHDWTIGGSLVLYKKMVQVHMNVGFDFGLDFQVADKINLWTEVDLGITPQFMKNMHDSSLSLFLRPAVGVRYAY